MAQCHEVKGLLVLVLCGHHVLFLRLQEYGASQVLGLTVGRYQGLLGVHLVLPSSLCLVLCLLFSPAWPAPYPSGH